MADYTLSTYQTNISDAYRSMFGAQPLGVQPSRKHRAVRAVAGSGKSFMIKHVLNHDIPRTVNAGVVAFNADIAHVLEPQLPYRTVKTYHALGLWGIRRGGQNPKVDNKKAYMILKSFLDRRNWGDLYPVVVRMVGLIKNNLIEDLSDESLMEIAIQYGLDLGDNWEMAFNATRRLFRESVAMTDVIDFDDMVSFHAYHSWVSLPQFEFLAVDEYQDTNRAQETMIEKCARWIMAVGDPKQSIYAFRGANSSAFSHFVDHFNAEVMPLSITYRNPLATVQYVNTHFPGIHFEGRPDAPEGRIGTSALDDCNFQPGDMILCRMNAPLVGLAFSLLRRGIKVAVRGREIGENLKTVIKQRKADDMGDLMNRLAQWRDGEVYKLTMAEKELAAEQVDDKYETILAISEGCYTIEKLLERIDAIFTNDIQPIVLSSVHKAKGLEADNVFILRPELIPSKRARTEEERDQEENIHYVAATRNRETMTFIRD